MRSEESCTGSGTDSARLPADLSHVDSLMSNSEAELHCRGRASNTFPPTGQGRARTSETATTLLILTETARHV